MSARGGDHDRTLIIFPGALGDLICFIPTLRAIGLRHPGTTLELIARSELARFAVGRTPIAHAHSIDRAEVAQLFTDSRKNGATREFFGGFTRIYAFFAADNDQFRQSLARLAPEVHFYPFRPPGAGHVAGAYLRALDPTAPPPAATRIRLLPADIAAASAVLARHAIEPRAFLLLLPGSGSPAKNWPAPSYVALARMLAPQLRSLCVIGPAEAELASVFRAAGIATSDGLALGEVAAVAAAARVFVGNDSGIAHLAAAVGAPGVVLFGPTDPCRWRPLGAVQIIRGESITKIPLAEVAAAIAALPIAAWHGYNNA